MRWYEMIWLVDENVYFLATVSLIGKRFILFHWWKFIDSCWLKYCWSPTLFFFYLSLPVTPGGEGQNLINFPTQLTKTISQTIGVPVVIVMSVWSKNTLTPCLRSQQLHQQCVRIVNDFADTLYVSIVNNYTDTETP